MYEEERVKKNECGSELLVSLLLYLPDSQHNKQTVWFSLFLKIAFTFSRKKPLTLRVKTTFEKMMV